jgi:hypothetical protein
MKHFSATASTLTLALMLLVVLATGAQAGGGGEGPDWMLVKGRDCSWVGEGHTGKYKDEEECHKQENGGEYVGGWEETVLLDKVLSGEELKLVAKLATSTFVFKTAALTIECTGAPANGMIIGGAPGLDDLEIHFEGCKAVSHPSCTVKSSGASSGTILFPAKGELVYIGTKKEAEEERGALGDRFTPRTGESFATVELLGSSCPLFTKGEREIKGSVIAEAYPVEKFASVEKLIFPSTSIKEGYSWLKTGEVKAVTSAVGFLGVVEAKLTGEESAELEIGGEWGTADSG